MSISLRKINAIFVKQLKNCYRNLNVVSVAFIAPLFFYIYLNIIPNLNNELSLYFFGMCSVMNIVMVGTLMMTYMISEEKEKCTLRVLMTSTVSPADFLIGNGLATWIVSMLMSAVLLFINGMIHNIFAYILVTALSAIAAIVLGAIIGLLSKNQLNASIISMPFLLVLLMLPIFSVFNETLHTIAKILFTMPLYSAIMNMESSDISISGILVILANIAVLTVVFIILYRYKKLDE